MRKKVTKTSPWRFMILAGCMLLVFNACKKEVVNIFNDKSQAKANVQWAKDYYEKSLAPKEKGFMSLQGLKLMNVKPGEKQNVKQVLLNWNAAAAEEQTVFDFVEVPLKSNFVSKTVFNASNNGQVSTAVDEKTLNAGFDRLMIFRNEDGTINERIVTYVPDKAYSDRHNGDITHNTITNMDKDFFGYLQYKDWQGKTEFIIRIENGASVRKYSNMQPARLPAMTSLVKGHGEMLYDSSGGGTNCLIITQSHQERWCYYDNWYDDVPRYCDPWETVIDGEYTWCPSDPNGGGGGGGTVPAPDPEPEPDRPDPCKGAKALSQNANYTANMNTLGTKLNMDRETGFIKYKNNTDPTSITAPSAGLYLPIPQPEDVASQSLEYINHQHFNADGSLSTMDFDDFQAYCVYLGTGKAANNNTFTLGVKTSYGSYSFILNDQSTFNTFFTNTFGPNSGTANGGTGAYDQMWARFFNESTGITKTNNGLVNEKHLIDLLANSGISLLKQNADGTWSAITKDAAGNIKKIECGSGGGAVE